MNSLIDRRTGALWTLIGALALAALLFAPGAQALEFEIVNESGRPDEEVFVTVVAHGAYEVPGIPEDVPQKLSEIPGGKMTIEKLVSGRVYISYGKGVEEGVTEESQTRFDWAEMTVTPAPADVANLTAVDQFAIGMRMEALNGSGETLETLGEANADTIFGALQTIPGGPLSTVRNSQGEILRVLSPVHSSAYPPLTEYVRSLAGQTLTLHTGLFQNPFGVSEYKAEVAPDGSITLRGAYESEAPLAEPPPPTITIPANQLLAEIYAPTTEHNNFEAAIRRDLLAGFSTGLWGGRYGNDALSFCTNPVPKLGSQVCPEGFNQPSFGDARVSLQPFPTCEQYAAVINQYSDSYGSAYSDAAKKVAVSLDQMQTKTLRLAILPDSGTAMPVHSGNPDCGAAMPSPATVPVTSASTAVGVGKGSPARATAKFRKRSTLTKGGFRLGRIVCAGDCARVSAVAKLGAKVVARGNWRGAAANRQLTVKLTKVGRRALSASGQKKWKLAIQATADGTDGTTTQLTARLELKRGRL
ncbi:MAG TPA: beta-1,3-glucanase family protein [Solirubrobacterales bacterium]|nr:beta-1,3-glucanase family protein [Solirubrobacterales bacterium]